MPNVLETHNRCTGHDPRSAQNSENTSAYGLGDVLLQQHQLRELQPVAYASRSMTETEPRYSQIEKEAMTLVWACEKFQVNIIGKSI